MEEFLSFPADQLLILAGLVVVVLIVLFILGRVLKLTTTLVKVGCIATAVLFLVVLVALWAMGS